VSKLKKLKITKKIRSSIPELNKILSEFEESEEAIGEIEDYMNKELKDIDGKIFYMSKDNNEIQEKSTRIKGEHLIADHVIGGEKYYFLVGDLPKKKTIRARKLISGGVILHKDNKIMILRDENISNKKKITKLAKTGKFSQPSREEKIEIYINDLEKVEPEIKRWMIKAVNKRKPELLERLRKSHWFLGRRLTKIIDETKKLKE
jgi:hypothetical protein